jgi:sulfate permease, SulP family
MSYFSDLLPASSDYKNLRRTWRVDFLAGITVGIVALPLALGFGITSGAGAQAGLITAIYAGVVAAIFGGSNYQVSGPTGAMTVVLVPIVAKYGVSSLMPLGLTAGILVIIMGATHLGSYLNKVPVPVLEGFTLGIAVVIALQQFPSALSSPTVASSNTLSTGIATFKHALNAGLHWPSLLIVGLTLLVKFSYPWLTNKIHVKFHIPASFLAIVVSTVVVQVFTVNTPDIGHLPRTLFIGYSLGGSHIKIWPLVVGGIEIALLAAIESLLSARVADQMAHIHEPTAQFKPNRELLGQGVATLVSSMVGGMPATGAIARTSVNIRSHASSRFSAIIHAIFLLVVVLALSPLISKIPLAALGGVLIGISLRIANPVRLRELLTTSKSDAVLLLFTAALVVVIGLIWAIGIGTITYFVVSYFVKQKSQNAKK